MIGKTLSHYQVIEKLGEGGMGVVYKARDTHLDRFVALKVLPPERVADPDRKRRFVQEAKAASALNHPSIITIYDIDQADGTDYIAMEYVAGKTLDELIPRKGMRLSLVLKYAIQIADALARAHGAGIIHRDLKPSNVMVDEHGLVKVLDFGLAKLTEAGPAGDDASTRTAEATTEKGTIVGTVSYMSPEQAEGRKLDARSDIFSFGAVLYEMLTGRRAFHGESKMAILAAILQKEPPAMEDVPPELRKLIARCLRKDPERRIQHIDDVGLALEELKEESDSGALATSARPARLRSAWIVAVIAGPVLIAAGISAWLAWRSTQSREPMRAVALTTFPGDELYPSFSPDGNHVAFAWSGPKQDNHDIYVQQIGAGSPLRLTTDPGIDYNPVWSPDGRWIAFLRGQLRAGKSELRLMPPLGGPERNLAEIQVRNAQVLPPYMAWCPDSNCLVVTDSPGEGKPDALFAVSLEAGEKRQLTNPQPPTLGDSNPALSPNGDRLVFRRNLAFASGELHWLSLREGLTVSGEARRLTRPMLNAVHPTWMPDSKEILFVARRSLWRLAVPAESAPARLPFVGEDGAMPTVSRPQPGRPTRLVYVRSFSDSNIWRISTSAPGAPASSTPVMCISSTREEDTAMFSPDGRRVAFSSNRSGDWEIWVSDPDGSNAVQLTSMGASDSGTPRWSPDGHLIAFDSNLEGHYEVYLIQTAGGKPRRVTSHSANSHVPSFSRDGKWIYFSSDQSGEFQIWRVPVSGGDEIQVTHNGGFAVFESPDGAYVYYTQTAGLTPSSLWRVSSSGGQPIKVLEGVVRRAFALVERGVYYIDRPAGQARLQFFTWATGRSATVSPNLGDISQDLTASPDGCTILYTRVDSSGSDLMLVENFR